MKKGAVMVGAGVGIVVLLGGMFLFFKKEILTYMAKLWLVSLKERQA